MEKVREKCVKIMFKKSVRKVREKCGSGLECKIYHVNYTLYTVN